MNTRRGAGLQQGFSLIELLVSIALGLLLMTGLTVLLVSFNDVADSVGQRADLQERAGLLDHLWGLALDGAGQMGCLADSAAVENFLNASWADLGLLRPWPAVEIVQEPAISPFFSGISNLAPDSQGLVIRGFAKPLGELIAQSSDGRGQAELLGPSARINSDDVVLLSDCRQAVIFSATQTRHSSGAVRFSWAAGEGVLDNRALEQSADSLSDASEWSLTPADFEAGSRLFGPVGRRIYIAESLTSTPQRRVFALWQKPVFGNALELVTGVQRMILRYGAWRTGEDAGQVDFMGYFDAPDLPQDARVVLLLVTLYVASHLSSDHPHWTPVSFALPLTSVPSP